MRHHARWILGFWKKHLGILPVLAVLTLLSAAVALSFPLVLKYVVDAAQAFGRAVATGPGEAARAERARLADLVWILLLVGVGRSLTNLYPMLRARTNGLLEMAVRREYFRRILDKGHGFFLRFRTGDIVTRLTDDVSGWLKIGWFLCSGIFRAFESLAFPSKLEERLGPRGIRVSGGQRQRLAIARALAARPDLLLMDDVTAALDAENEEELWDEIRARHPEISAVIVTHRLATARRADRIVVMDRGRITDQGAHEELAARSALYRRLTRG